MSKNTFKIIAKATAVSAFGITTAILAPVVMFYKAAEGFTELAGKTIDVTKDAFVEIDNLFDK